CIYVGPNSSFIVYFLGKVRGSKDLLYGVRDRKDYFYVQEFEPVSVVETY
ncbi:22357_t:CDS:2, partial [Gigaspora margarita]